MNKLIKILFAAALIVVVVLNTGCDSCNKTKQLTDKKVVLKIVEKKKQIERKKISLSYQRLDYDIFNIDKQNIPASIIKLKNKYGVFFDLYTGKILNIGTTKTANFETYLKDFCADAVMNEVFLEVKKQYSNTNDLQVAFEDAFTNYNILFPSKKIPNITFMITGFNYAMVATENTLGISTEMYLGANCNFYKQLQFPAYKSQMQRRDLLVCDALRAWVSTEFDIKTKQQDLLSVIIKEGKTMYCLDNIFIDIADSTKIAFTTKQTAWLQRNEGKVWKHFVDKKLLFSNSYKEIMNLTKEAPFSMGLPRECPGRVGNWIGWQIVRSYMAKNPSISLDKLMLESDAQKILNKSGYRPI